MAGQEKNAKKLKKDLEDKLRKINTPTMKELI